MFFFLPLRGGSPLDLFLEVYMPKTIETDEDIKRIIELCRSQPKDMPATDVVRKAFELYKAEPRVEPLKKAS